MMLDFNNMDQHRFHLASFPFIPSFAVPGRYIKQDVEGPGSQHCKAAQYRLGTVPWLRTVLIVIGRSCTFCGWKRLRIW